MTWEILMEKSAVANTATDILREGILGWLRINSLSEMQVGVEEYLPVVVSFDK